MDLRTRRSAANRAAPALSTALPPTLIEDLSKPEPGQGEGYVEQNQQNRRTRTSTFGHSFGALSVHQPQAKLAVSQPADPLELEADHIADAVMHTDEFENNDAREGEETEPLILTSASSRLSSQSIAPLEGTNSKPHDRPNAVEGLVASTVSAGGTPLGSTTRRYMESRFGHDFGRVRVHADPVASQSAQAVQAHAYTIGSDVVFGPGKYAPGTPAGDRLLAHELTHVVQQTAGEHSGSTGKAEATGGNDVIRAIQRKDDDSGGATVAAPIIKHTFTVPDKELGGKDLSYLEAKFLVGGSIDLEITLPNGKTSNDSSTTPAAPDKEKEEEGTKLKPAAGINSSKNGATYQAEVTAEFEKHTMALLGEATPKIKFGGEASESKGKLGIEFSIEGKNVEPKFAINFLEGDLNEGKGFTFLSLEAALDWKMAEWPYTAADGTSIKIIPKVTPKIAIEPDYKQIGARLLEEMGSDVAAEIAITGGFILAGTVAIVGFFLTYMDGYEEAAAIDEASLKGRPNFVKGFINGATAEGEFTDDYMMEGHNWGTQWRNDLKAGKGGKGFPIPDSVITTKSKEGKAQIEEAARSAANQILHQMLVEKYWDIHYIEKVVPFAEIDTTYKMLMEGQGFGRPGSKEGKG